MHNETRRLKRSKDNKVIWGIFGGLGEYLEVDPVVLRLAYVFVTVFTGIFPGIIAYLLGALVVPKNRPHA